MSIKVEISVGELLDKITILEIKTERLTDPEKLKNINNELSILKQQWNRSPYAKNNLADDLIALKKVNEQLWEIEDAIREKEKKQLFDDEFIKLARAVYFTNDERSTIKKTINNRVGSGLTEEKSYSDYR